MTIDSIGNGLASGTFSATLEADQYLTTTPLLHITDGVFRNLPIQPTY